MVFLPWCFSGRGVEYRRLSFYLFLRFSVLKLKSAASAIRAASNFSCEKNIFITFACKKLSSLQIVIPNNTHLMQSKKWCLSFLEIWTCEDTHLLESGTWSVAVMCIRSQILQADLASKSAFLPPAVCPLQSSAEPHWCFTVKGSKIFPNDLYLYNGCLFWEPIQPVRMGATATAAQRSPGAVMSHGNSQLRWCLTLQVSLGWSYQMSSLNAEES